MLALQATGLGAQLEDVQARRIVDEDGRVGQPRDMLVQDGEFGIREVALAQLLGTDACFTGDQTRHQLGAAHLQTEDGHCPLVLHRDIARHAQHEGGLPHRRSRGHDHHITSLPAGGEFVQLHEARRDTAHPTGLRLGVLDLLDGPLDQVAHRLVVALQVAACDGIEVLLRFVQQIEHVSGVVVGITGHLRADADHLAQDVLLADDTRVILHVRTARHFVGELADVEGSANDIQFAALLQLLGHGQDVDRLIVAEEAKDGVEDLLVSFHIEAVRLQDVNGLVHGVALEHERTQNRLLQFGSLRWKLARFQGRFEQGCRLPAAGGAARAVR